MNIVTLLQPQRIVFGDGCSPQCGQFLAQKGCRRVLLVSNPLVLPLLDDINNALEKSGITTLDAPLILSEPTISDFQRVCSFAQSERVDGVIGAGGGSVIDIAKLVAAMAGGQQAVADVFGINLLRNRSLPLVCLPTTAGTGAEVSPNAILLDESDELKKGVVSPFLVPDAAFVDPLLTHSLPANITASTGMDALTHCIEAYANQFAHPAVDTYALQGIKLISTHLFHAVQDGSNGCARSALALGSLYGGLCLGPVNTAAVHALSYPLGGRFHVPHGVSNAVLLPHVLRFNLRAAPDRYAEISQALGAQGGGTVLSTAENGIDFLAQLSRNCGVPQRLSELGITRETIPGMAKAAMQVTRLLKNNPRPLTESDAMNIYEKAY